MTCHTAKCVYVPFFIRATVMCERCTPCCNHDWNVTYHHHHQSTRRHKFRGICDSRTPSIQRVARYARLLVVIVQQSVKKCRNVGGFSTDLR